MRKRTAGICIFSALMAGLLLGLLGARYTIPKPADRVTPALSTAHPSPTPPEVTPVIAMPTPPPHTGNMPLLLQSVQVLDALKARDFAALSRLSAKEGVTFTPFSTVDLEQNITLTQEQLKKLDSDETTYVWGTANGTGEPLSLTPLEYFNQFVWNADYTTAPTVGLDRVLTFSNALENVQTAYPDCHFVEYHFPSLDPSKEGFDWCSLKLVFRTVDEKPLLVGLIHSEWTI